ncbi:hypothetical protein AX17_005525 [Amanita inopinata Kibby_2008]|nr:hypothetical protein AX17_005525 [Amanita inopinata Kibby_2008]
MMFTSTLVSLFIAGSLLDGAVARPIFALTVRQTNGESDGIDTAVASALASVTPATPGTAIPASITPISPGVDGAPANAFNVAYPAVVTSSKPPPSSTPVYSFATVKNAQLGEYERQIHAQRGLENAAAITTTNVDAPQASNIAVQSDVASLSGLAPPTTETAVPSVATGGASTPASVTGGVSPANVAIPSVVSTTLAAPTTTTFATAPVVSAPATGETPIASD